MLKEPFVLSFFSSQNGSWYCARNTGCFWFVPTSDVLVDVQCFPASGGRTFARSFIATNGIGVYKTDSSSGSFLLNCACALLPTCFGGPSRGKTQWRQFIWIDWTFGNPPTEKLKLPPSLWDQKAMVVYSECYISFRRSDYWHDSPCGDTLDLGWISAPFWRRAPHIAW